MKKSKLLWIIIGFIVFIHIISLIMYIKQCCFETALLYISDLLPIICSFVAVISLLKTYRSFGEFEFPKFAWLMILIGISLDFIAEAIYSGFELFNLYDVKSMDYSLADYFWCLGYIPLFIGLNTMVLGYKRSGFPMGNKIIYTVLSPLVLIIITAVFYLILLPIIKDDETELLAKIFYLFYPIADTLIVIPALLLMYITSLFGKGIISKPWKYLAIGFICFTFADIIFSYLNWNEQYDNGHPIDIAWNLGYLFIGLAGIYQVELIESVNKGGAQ